MPKLFGVFDKFKDLDRIPITDISRWLPFKSQALILENFVGNRILYSQTIPVMQEDLQIDLAILREVVRASIDDYYDSKTQKLIIPKSFIQRFPPLKMLVTAIIETINPTGIVTLYIKDDSGISEVIGSLIAPAPSIIEQTRDITINGQILPLKQGMLSFIPLQERHLRIKLDHVDEMMVPGGDLGLLIDLRRRTI